MTYQIFYGETNALIDTEDADIKTLHLNDQELTMVHKENRRQLFGFIPNTSFYFVISGELTEEEITSVFLSLQPERGE